MKLSVRNIFRNAFAILSVALSGFVAFLLISGTQAYAVQSDSMEPTLQRGDVVFVRKVVFDDLTEGDVISATFPESDGIFTHRIVRVDAKANQVYTRGDHNLSDDPMPTAASHIRGKLWFSVPYLGYISLYRTSDTILYIALGLALFLIVLRLILSRRRKTDR